MTTAVTKFDHHTPAGSDLAKAEQELSAEISKAFHSFYATGKVLQKIRDERLYKQAGFTSFERYLKDRPQFDIKRAHADRLIRAKSTADKITKVDPTGVISWTEWSIRELAHEEIDGRYLKTIVNRIAKKVDADNPLTAKMVREVRDDYMGWTKQKAEAKAQKEAEEVAQGQSPAEVLAEIESTAQVWIESLATVPADFWKAANAEDKHCVRDAAKALSELAATLRKH